MHLIFLKAAALVLGITISTVAMAGYSLKPEKAPPDSMLGDKCFLLPFEKITIRPGFITDSWVLEVDLWKTKGNINISLDPLFYPAQPDYWEIRVIGCLGGDVGTADIKPYTASLWLATEVEKVGWVSFLGKSGIEIVGAGKKVKEGLIYSLLLMC